MTRRRLLGLAIATVLLAIVLAPATAIAADHVLAVEAPAPGEPLPGPEPRLEGHEFGPRDYDVPWTFGMGVALTGVAVLATIGVGLGYWLLVARPAPDDA